MAISEDPDEAAVLTKLALMLVEFRMAKKIQRSKYAIHWRSDLMAHRGKEL